MCDERREKNRSQMISLKCVIKGGKKWVTDDIFERCDERRELKNKKHDAQRVSQYREIGSRTRKAMKQAKENWTEEQCEKIDTNLIKNNAKCACQIVKDLATTKKEESAPSKTSQGKVSLKIEKSSLIGQNIAVICTIMTHRVTMQY